MQEPKNFFMNELKNAIIHLITSRSFLLKSLVFTYVFKVFHKSVDFFCTVTHAVPRKNT